MLSKLLDNEKEKVHISEYEASDTKPSWFDGESLITVIRDWVKGSKDATSDGFSYVIDKLGLTHEGILDDKTHSESRLGCKILLISLTLFPLLRL